MALIDELRSLSPVLSPSVRAAGGEVADLVSALVAYTEHGDPLLEAAHQGPQAVADFYHDHAVDQAKEAGHDEPVKGAPVASGNVTTAATAGPGGGVSQSQFQELAGKFDQLLAAIAGNHTPVRPPEGSTPSPSPAVVGAEGHAATADAPAGVAPADAPPAPYQAPDQTGVA